MNGHQRLLAIDPGPETCGVVRLRLTAGRPPEVELADNWAPVVEALRKIEELIPCDIVAVEWLVSYGSCVGASVLDTARVVGRIEDRASQKGIRFCSNGLTRPEIGLKLAGQRGARPAQIKEACRQIYRDAGILAGSGADRTRGVKADPGPLYAVRGEHAWSALAVGLAIWSMPAWLEFLGRGL